MNYHSTNNINQKSIYCKGLQHITCFFLSLFELSSPHKGSSPSSCTWLRHVVAVFCNLFPIMTQLFDFPNTGAHCSPSESISGMLCPPSIGSVGPLGQYAAYGHNSILLPWDPANCSQKRMASS
mmetsp:Transcript_28971/g.52965  ORF Transcript_28971/g.52965 Transcript_28971/m.52965 type:complete len:124 (-) Transcript_28971:2006-2377(-)